MNPIKQKFSVELHLVFFFVLTVIGMSLPFMTFNFTRYTSSTVEIYSITIFGYRNLSILHILAALLGLPSIYLIFSSNKRTSDIGAITLLITVIAHVIVYFGALSYWWVEVHDSPIYGQGWWSVYYYSAGAIMYPLGILGTIINLFRKYKTISH